MDRDVQDMALERQLDFAGKRAHVIGIARSGLAAAEILKSVGANVVMHDQKNVQQLEDALNKVRKMGLDVRTGDEAYEGIEHADLVIASPGVPVSCPGIVTAMEHSITIISEIEFAYRISPAPIIAITGTNGKTTTSAMIGDILREQGRQVLVAGNIVAGEIRLPLSRAAYRASASEIIVAEISSFQLEWISSFKPRVAALLNISADHMDRHSDMDQYSDTKARIFQCQDTTDTAIVNADDPRVMSYVPQIKSAVWQFSRKTEVEFGTFARGSEVWARTAAGDQLICDTSSMKLRGAHNVENVLAASAAILSFGAEKDFVQEIVDKFEPLEHRLEPVIEVDGVEFLNNSMCTNMLAALRSLEAIGRPAVVIAGGKGKGDDYVQLGEAFNKYAKHVVLIGDDAALIEEAVNKAGFRRISHALSMEEAVEVAWRHAKPGDAIVLSPGCASFDMFKNFEHRGQVFKSAVHALADRVGNQR